MLHIAVTMHEIKTKDTSNHVMTGRRMLKSSDTQHYGVSELEFSDSQRKCKYESSTSAIDLII